MEALKQIIEESFGLRPEHFPPEVQNSVDEVIKLLQQGKLRVAEKIDGNWVTHEWIKKAVLLSFQLYPNKMVRAGDLSFFDKVPSRFDHFSESDWKESGIRCVPTAVARHGSYIAPSVVLMPSFVNIGAYIGENTMVDTWSTVGSCAQVGKNCHLSGGVGIGGVLEPLQASPTIIEDNCFIGARSEIVEGVVVEENSVISWVSSSDKARRFMTVRPAKSIAAECLPVPLLSLEACLLLTASTILTARLSLSA